MTISKNLLILARLKGSDKKYREWVRQQPSCVSGDFSEWVNGEGRCIAAHVRRAGEAGTGYKPEYSCVPLTNTEHQLQHSKAESILQQKPWFDAQAVIYLTKWIKHG